MLPKLQFAIRLIVYWQSKLFFFPHYYLRQDSSYFNKVWLLKSLRREIVSAVPAQAMKNLRVSKITAQLKSILISMCV